MRLAVLVSGRGSNLESVLSAVAGGHLDGIEPVLVISNRSDVHALEVARGHHVACHVLRRSDFGGDPAARDAAIGRTLTASSVELTLLAGYDQVLQPAYFAAFAGRTINIHPSLLPKHGGRGMVGAAVHRAVLAARDTFSGATVHEVISELDEGPILAQVSVPVDPDDDENTLAARVLTAEHQLLVATLASLAAEGFGGTLSARIAGGRRV
jgi:phosphoribosylglycinamide formyltransferase 1